MLQAKYEEDTVLQSRVMAKGADLCSTLGGRTDNLDCGLEGAAKALEVGRCGRGLIQWRRNEFESRGAPVRRESGGTDPARSAGIFFVVVPLHFFWPQKYN